MAKYPYLEQLTKQNQPQVPSGFGSAEPPTYSYLSGIAEQGQKQREVEQYEAAGGGIMTGLERGGRRLKQTLAGAGASLGDFLAPEAPTGPIGQFLRDQAERDKQEVMRQEEAIQALPAHPTMQRAVEAANKEEGYLGAIGAFGKEVWDSPDTLGFMVDQAAELVPQVATFLAGSKGVDKIIPMAMQGIPRLATQLGGGGFLSSVANTYGPNVAEALQQGMDFDQAEGRAALQSAVQGGVDALTAAVIPWKIGPNQVTNIPAQTLIQMLGGATGEVARKAVVGEEAEKGEVVAEALLEALGLPGEAVSAMYLKAKQAGQKKPPEPVPEEAIGEAVQEPPTIQAEEVIPEEITIEGIAEDQDAIQERETAEVHEGMRAQPGEDAGAVPAQERAEEVQRGRQESEAQAEPTQEVTPDEKALQEEVPEQKPVAEEVSEAVAPEAAAEKDQIGRQLEAYAKEEDTKASDWASREYKKNTQTVELLGDGPARDPYMQIGTINENRRRKRVKEHRENAVAIRKFTKDYGTDEKRLNAYRRIYDEVSAWPQKELDRLKWSRKQAVQETLNREFFGMDGFFGDETPGGFLYKTLEPAREKAVAEEKRQEEAQKKEAERREKLSPEERDAEDKAFWDGFLGISGEEKPTQPEAPTPQPTRKAEEGGGAPVAVEVPQGAGARKATEGQKKKLAEAQEQLRQAINNQNLVGKQRADTIANLRELTNFWQANRPDKVKTDYWRGDQIGYTGVVDKDGLQEFIYLEGHQAGSYGVKPSKEVQEQQAEQQRQEFKDQQEKFRRLKESEAAPPSAETVTAPSEKARPAKEQAQADYDAILGFARKQTDADETVIADRIIQHVKSKESPIQGNTATARLDAFKKSLAELGERYQGSAKRIAKKAVAERSAEPKTSFTAEEVFEEAKQNQAFRSAKAAEIKARVEKALTGKGPFTTRQKNAAISKSAREYEQEIGERKAKLKEIKFFETVEDEKGERHRVKRTAQAMLDEIDGRLDDLYQLKECIG